MTPILGRSYRTGRAGLAGAERSGRHRFSPLGRGHRGRVSRCSHCPLSRHGCNAPTALVASGGDHDALLADMCGNPPRWSFSRPSSDAMTREWKYAASGCMANHCLPSTLTTPPCGRSAKTPSDSASDRVKTHLTTVDKTQRTVELTYDNVEAQCISTDAEVFDATVDIGRVAIAADTGYRAKHAGSGGGIRQAA